MSALLERRARFNAQSAPPPVAPTMNFNLNIPAEVASLLRPGPQAHAPPPAVDAPQAAGPARDPGPILQPLHVVSNTMLISSDRLPGPELTLADFCSKYRLTDGISQKLNENGYAGSHTFEYASWDEMRDAGLKSGEIAQLKHAITKWSTARNL